MAKNLKEFFKDIISLYSSNEGRFDFETKFDSPEMWYSSNWDIKKIKEDIELVSTDSNLDWAKLAKETGMSNHEYFRGLEEEYGQPISSEQFLLAFEIVGLPILFPEFRLQKLEAERLRRIVFYILRDIGLMTDQWVDLEFILSYIKEHESMKWDKLRAFHVETIFNEFTRVGMFYPVRILRKFATHFPEKEFHLNPIIAMRYFQFDPKFKLALFPDSLYEINDVDIKEGLLLPEFAWTKEQSVIVLKSFMEYWIKKKYHEIVVPEKSRNMLIDEYGFVPMKSLGLGKNGNTLIFANIKDGQIDDLFNLGIDCMCYKMLRGVSYDILLPEGIIEDEKLGVFTKNSNDVREILSEVNHVYNLRLDFISSSSIYPWYFYVHIENASYAAIFDFGAKMAKKLIEQQYLDIEEEVLTFYEKIAAVQ